MKRILSVILILVVIFICGCANDKVAKKVPSILLGESFWVADSDDMPYLSDAIARKDTEYMKQLMLEGKVFLVDRDTKVTRIGDMTTDNNATIQFNEGRYTNKIGLTHSSNVVAEKDFPVYAEAQKQKKIALIRDSLTSTEKYTDVIATGKSEEIKRIRDICLSKTNELKRFRQGKESGILEQAEMAINIIFERDFALSAYEYFVEYSAKAEQEISSTRNFRVYNSMQQNYRNDIDKHSQKAEQLRQKFRDKYGY